MQMAHCLLPFILQLSKHFVHQAHQFFTWQCIKCNGIPRYVGAGFEHGIALLRLPLLCEQPYSTGWTKSKTYFKCCPVKKTQKIKEGSIRTQQRFDSRGSSSAVDVRKRERERERVDSSLDSNIYISRMGRKTF